LFATNLSTQSSLVLACCHFLGVYFCTSVFDRANLHIYRMLLDIYKAEFENDVEEHENHILDKSDEPKSISTKFSQSSFLRIND